MLVLFSAGTPAPHIKRLPVNGAHHGGVCDGRETADWANHLERVGDFDDILVVDIAETTNAGIWYAWASAIPGRLEDHHPQDGTPLEFTSSGHGGWIGDVDLPGAATGIVEKDTKIRLTVTQRN